MMCIIACFQEFTRLLFTIIIMNFNWNKNNFKLLKKILDKIYNLNYNIGKL